MAQQIIGVGSAPNDGQGNPLRTAFIKCNDNFSELYSRVQTSPPTTLVGQLGDTAGMYAYDSQYFYYCFADFDGSSIIWAQVTQVGNVVLTTLNNGNSSIGIPDISGNITITANGTPNVVVVSQNGQYVTGLLSTTGNVTAPYYFGNGSQLTGLPETYANANVAAFLQVYNGNILANNITVSDSLSTLSITATGNVVTTANVSAGNVLSTGQISAAGNILSQSKISATGNIETSGYFIGTFQGNISGNFVVPGANTQVIFNTNGNADASAGMTFDVSGPNLFTVLGTISSQGNVIGGNLTTAGVVTATGNITGGNLRTAGLLTVTGNITGGNLLTAGLISATSTVTSSANITGGNLITAGLLTVTGNITGGNIRTAGQVTATGNVYGNTVIVINDVQVGGNVSATSHTGSIVSVTGNITGGNLRTSGLLTATGNINGGNILTTGQVSATGNITGNNLSGGLITGTLTTGSQPNITAVGTLSALTVSGNITPGGIAMSAGNATIGNLFVSGTTTISGNIQQISGNSGQFFGNATTGFDALYAGLPAGFSLLTQSVMNFVTQFNGYSQVNNQNQSNGNEATVDMVLTGDNGNDSTYFFDIGFTGSGYDPAVAVLNNALGNVVTPNDAYMYTTGNVAAANPSNMVLGTIDAGSYVRIFVGGPYNTNVAAQFNDPNGNSTVDITGGIRVKGNATVACITNNSGNGIGNIGSSTGYFNTIFAKATSAQYADLAENYESDTDYEAGTVVIFGGEKEITISSDIADERVAGVISASPAHLMNAGLDGLAVALRGRVPVKVVGPVVKGDSLVTSSTAGFAQSVGRDRSYGQAVFAKALETDIEPGQKIIEAVIL